MSPISGIVTLLSNPLNSEVESLWRMLDDECGTHLDATSEFVHFSFHVAENYNLERLIPVLKEISDGIQPFKVQTSGLGIFSGEKPVLYIPLVKDSQLLQFHEFIWKRVAPVARGINQQYAPHNWMPHITLAQDIVNCERLDCMISRIANQPFNWELMVDNITYIRLGDGKSNEDIHHYQLTGNIIDISPRLPLSAGSRSALVIVDMQEHFFNLPERREGLEEVVQNINQLINYFDDNKLPIVHAISSFDANGSNWDLKMRVNNTPELIEGEHDTQILSNIQISDRHRIIHKTRYSAFFKTDLAQLLNAENVHRVVVVGAYTHYCVNATIFDAYAHDFVPCIVTDAVISHLESESELLISRMRRNGYHTFKTSEFLREPA